MKAVALLLPLLTADNAARAHRDPTFDPVAQPRFHVRPQCAGCKGADPDFPFYDERHQMYHLMYQDHLAEPQTQMGPGKGPVPSNAPPAPTPCLTAVSLRCMPGSRAGLGPLGVA